MNVATPLAARLKLRNSTRERTMGKSSATREVGTLRVSMVLRRPVLLFALVGAIGATMHGTSAAQPLTVAFDYLSASLPRQWQIDFNNSYVAAAALPQANDTSNSTCSFSISPARAGNGNVLFDLESVRRSNVEARYLAGEPKIGTLSDGWQLASNTYRHPWIATYLQIIVVASRGGIMQSASMSYKSRHCVAVADAVLQSIRVGNQRQRVSHLGQQFPLNPPVANRSGTTPEARGPKGVACRTGTVMCLMAGNVGDPCYCASPGGMKFGTVTSW